MAEVNFNNNEVSIKHIRHMCVCVLYIYNKLIGII